jgi:hypothetical protein
MASPKNGTARRGWSRAALAALAGLEPGLAGLELVETLRRSLGPDEARRAAALHGLRRRAADKLADAAGLLLTRVGLEQATDRRVAAARARRIAERGGGRWVWDATAGIGGDARELCAQGLRVIAGDLDPECAACLAHNLALPQAGVARIPARGVLAVRADALRPPLATPRAGLLLLDPDRRPDGGGRAGDPAAWAPPLAAALHLAAGFAGAVLKLPPAFDPTAPIPFDGPHAWQWTSLGGELKEVALWLGCLARGAAGVREATALERSGAVHALSGVPAARAPLDDDGARNAAFLVEPDPAAIRAGLIGNLGAELGLAPVHAEIAYLGGRDAPRACAAAGLGRAFRVLAATALDAKRVRRMLAEHDVGAVTVKKRGHADSADRLAARLRGPGRRRGLLVVARLAASHHCWLVEPWPSPADRSSS